MMKNLIANIVVIDRCRCAAEDDDASGCGAAVERLGYFDTYRASIVIVGDWDKDQVTPFGDVTMYDAEGNKIQD